MKTNADLRPYVTALLATAYVIVFWALGVRAPAQPNRVEPAGWRVATEDEVAPTVTVTRAPPAVRGRIRTRSS
jgi:hypothetical protein